MAQNENTLSEAAQDEILASILQRISPSAPAPQEATPTASTGGGDLLSSLLSNPELIAKLPTILSSVKPLLDMLKTSGTAPQSAFPHTAIPTNATPSADADSKKDAPASLVHHSHASDSRTALLCAMKPYLSRDRQNAIDYIVKIGRLGDILKTL